MKRIVSVILICVSFFIAGAQQPVKSLPLGITTGKTTFLLFPFKILHVDRGTQDIIIEQIDPAKNALMVKAAISGFLATNLTILTEDGAVYAFDVHFENDPVTTVYRFPVVSPNPTYNSAGKEMNLQDLDIYSKMILNKKKSIRGLRTCLWDMQGMVKGIFVKGDVLFFQLCLKNQSTIDYTPEIIHFYIRDQKMVKRSATQEVELKPIYTYGNPIDVPGGQEKNCAFAFEKFTIPEAKYLFIEIMEKNGGRNLRVRVFNNKIVKAQVLPEIEGN
jgi:conjugative transposon TraN protein